MFVNAFINFNQSNNNNEALFTQAPLDTFYMYAALIDQKQQPRNTSTHTYYLNTTYQLEAIGYLLLIVKFVNLCGSICRLSYINQQFKLQTSSVDYQKRTRKETYKECLEKIQIIVNFSAKQELLNQATRTKGPLNKLSSDRVLK